MISQIKLSTIIATGFGIGFIKKAPGTFGSILAFPLYFLFTYLLIVVKGGVASLASLDLINSMLVLITLLFFIGIWASECYCNENKKYDPKEIVIDEVVGQMLNIALVMLFLPYIGEAVISKFKDYGIDALKLVIINLFASFVLFRLFDITKPWPIKTIEASYKNGFGVMIDDICAAVLRCIMQFFILFAIIDQLK